MGDFDLQKEKDEINLLITTGVIIIGISIIFIFLSYYINNKIVKYISSFIITIIGFGFIYLTSILMNIRNKIFIIMAYIVGGLISLIGIIFGITIRKYSSTGYSPLEQRPSITSRIGKGLKTARDVTGRGLKTAGVVAGRGLKTAGDVAGRGYSKAKEGLKATPGVVGKGLSATGRGLKTVSGVVKESKMVNWVNAFYSGVTISLVILIIYGFISNVSDALGAIILSLVIAFIIFYFIFYTDIGKKNWRKLLSTKKGAIIVIGILLIGTFFVWGVLKQKGSITLTLGIFILHLAVFGLMYFLIYWIKWPESKDRIRNLKRRLRKTVTIDKTQYQKKFHETLDKIEKNIADPEIFEGLDELPDNNEAKNKILDMQQGLNEILEFRKKNIGLFEPEKVIR